MLEASYMVGVCSALVLVAAGALWWRLLRRVQLGPESRGDRNRKNKAAQVLVFALVLSMAAAILAMGNLALG